MTILLIEDDERVADLIGRGLAEEGFIIERAADGLAGHRMAMNTTYDLVILDIILPRLNGLDLCQQIRLSQPDMPIIMLTALGTTNDKIEGFDAGADDYLVKPFDFRELFVRIRTLLKRQGTRTAEPAGPRHLADLELDPRTRTARRAGQEIDLTPKEYNLLEYMLRHQGRVLPRAEIAEKVWQTTFDTGTNFIDVYINYLRRKVDRDFEPKLIHTKPGVGFILKAS
ncbi:response regulator transcription factor [uncultured Spirosoma sp.]|uniref:response regulator transcription factor n=1 Tax=uncultured Spirosoma sp. TaxID=278208 RepID=UPI00258E0A6F|nr:response regulator transcription factor [uncultured Spirosoma sp.]